MGVIILIGSFFVQYIFAIALILYDFFVRKDQDTAKNVFIAFIVINIMMRYRLFEILAIAILLFTVLILKSKTGLASKILYAVFLVASSLILAFKLAPALIPSAIAQLVFNFMILSVIFLPIMATFTFRKYWVLRKSGYLWAPKGFFSRSGNGADAE